MCGEPQGKHATSQVVCFNDNLIKPLNIGYQRKCLHTLKMEPQQQQCKITRACCLTEEFTTLKVCRGLGVSGATCLKAGNPIQVFPHTVSLGVYKELREENWIQGTHIWGSILKDNSLHRKSYCCVSAQTDFLFCFSQLEMWKTGKGEGHEG